MSLFDDYKERTGREFNQPFMSQWHATGKIGKRFKDDAPEYEYENINHSEQRIWVHFNPKGTMETRED